MPTFVINHTYTHTHTAPEQVEDCVMLTHNTTSSVARLQFFGPTVRIVMMVVIVITVITIVITYSTTIVTI